jgi:tetratricopeptide (TPR) repeat protein
MRSLPVCVALVFAGANLFALRAFTADILPPREDKKVMVIDWQAKLADDNDQPIDTPLYLGDILTVVRTDDHRLYVKHGWILDSHVRSPEKAIDYLTDKITAEPGNPSLYHDRATAYANLKDFDNAIADANTCIQLYSFAGPQYLAYGYHSRGLVWLDKREYDLAIRDFTRAIEYDPTFKFPYTNRGLAYRYSDKYQEALDDFNEAIRLEPDCAFAYGNRAFIWATCPDEKLRDGKQALESATRACELSHYHDSGPLDDLAAAHAELGNFAEAVKWETKAIDMGLESHNCKTQEELEDRYRLYMVLEPYRDKPRTQSAEAPSADK